MHKTPANCLESTFTSHVTYGGQETTTGLTTYKPEEETDGKMTSSSMPTLDKCWPLCYSKQLRNQQYVYINHHIRQTYREIYLRGDEHLT